MSIETMIVSALGSALPLKSYLKLYLVILGGMIQDSNEYAIIVIKGTHNADSIIESKVIYYLEQCGLGV